MEPINTTTPVMKVEEKLYSDDWSLSFTQSQQTQVTKAKYKNETKNKWSLKNHFF
jgi:hypothetical protein